MARRSFWGWGYEGAGLTADEVSALGAMLAARLGVDAPRPIAPPRLEDVRLSPARLDVPDALAGLVRADAFSRASHTYGKAFRDVVRGLEGDFAAAPDAVAFPASEADVVRLLDFCDGARVAAIPYGGGSSVVGGVEARLPKGAYRGALSIDLGALDQVLEVDATSRAARVACGILGPALEAALRPHGLTLRHYPQSFEVSSLGGWIVTRAGGHFATLATRIDDAVEAVRLVTPTGVLATRRLPSSGAGPAPERLVLGSEGALGIVTEAWVRLHARPRHRASATARFGDFFRAADAARGLAQAGLYPSNCRVLDADEALQSGAGDGTEHLLLVGFESADHGVEPWLDRALEIVRDAGGVVVPGSRKVRAGDEGERDGRAGAWRAMFLRAPYLRDALVTLGYVVETFETAVTWDRFEPFCRAVRARAERAVREIARAGLVACRVTHVYPDGAAPYFTVVARGSEAGRVAQWDAIKAAVTEAIVDEGGTVTHHHAVGRDHMPGYVRERSPAFARALAAVKRELDPNAVMNPGVLVPLTG
ncbi:MAG TPA: FAD-binding oxidoreductase [Minicystis sp.]|nr:FAD-binding oxidoreductase [Minicystis sp.]